MKIKAKDIIQKFGEAQTGIVSRITAYFKTNGKLTSDYDEAGLFELKDAGKLLVAKGDERTAIIADASGKWLVVSI